MSDDAAEKNREYQREVYRTRPERDAAAAAGLITQPKADFHCLRCNALTHPCTRQILHKGEDEKRDCGAPFCDDCGLCTRAHFSTPEEKAERERIKGLAKAEADAAVAEAVDQVYEFPAGTPLADRFGWVMVDSVEGPQKVRGTQELPEGFDALNHEEKAAVLRGEVIPIVRRCYATGCKRNVSICDELVRGSDGKERECGFSNCYLHGCRKGHPPKSRAARAASKPKNVPKLKVAKKPAATRDKPSQFSNFTDEQVWEIRREWEEGMGELALEKKYALTNKQISKWRAMRRPDGTEWEKKPGGVRVEVLQDRPPDFYQWLKDVKFKILSEEEGEAGGWVQFEPWPAQHRLIDARLERRGAVVSKSTRIGATTCIQIADLYSWMWRQGPAYIHWVSQDLFQSQERLQQARDMLDPEQVEIPDWQRDRMELGGKQGTAIFYRTKRYRQSITTHAPSIKTARGIAGTDMLMDEAAFMPYQEEIYKGFVGRLADQKFSIMVISSANPDDNWFRYMLEHAEEHKLESWLLDYRARPGRDEAWFDEQVARMGGDRDAAEQEFMGKASKKGNDAFDVPAMRRRVKDVPWIGEQPRSDRFYAHGIDQSGMGSAATVDVIGDVTDVPAQVVKVIKFDYDDGAALLGKGRSQQKSEWADQQALVYPGPVFVDCTTDQATVEYMQHMGKVMVRFRGMQEIKEVEDGGIRCLRYPRLVLLENAVKLVETGRVVVHEHFESLYVALKTARRYGDVEARKRPGVLAPQRGKRSGKSFGDNVDELDAFLLFCLALTELGGGGNTGVSGASVSRKSGQPRQVWKPPKRRLW